MRIAICLAGRIGSALGKSDDAVDRYRVLEVAAAAWESHVLAANDPRPDVYAHCWDYDMRMEVMRHLPIRDFAFEAQRSFEIPVHVPGDEPRRKAHYSRWYSAQRSVRLMLDSGERYDLAMLARFDLAWRRPVVFDEIADLGVNEVAVVGWWRSGNRRKLMDLWMVARPETLARVVELYDRIGDYCLPGGCRFKDTISSHRLLAYHLDKLGLRAREWMRHDHETDPKLSDCPLVRHVLVAPSKRSGHPGDWMVAEALRQYGPRLDERRAHAFALSGYTVEKPWGREVWLEINRYYALKRIEMRAGHRSSLQRHVHKDESNYVLSGTARVEIRNDDGDAKMHDVGPGEGWTVPAGWIHRVTAVTDYVAIEVSTPHLDDVERLQDDAGREHGRIAAEHRP